MCIVYRISCVCVPFVRINPLVLCYEITSNLFNSFAFCLCCSVFLLSPLLSGCGRHAQHQRTLCAVCVCEWVRCFITQIITLHWNSVFVRWISKAARSKTHQKPNQIHPAAYVRAHTFASFLFHITHFYISMMAQMLHCLEFKWHTNTHTRYSLYGGFWREEEVIEGDEMALLNAAF